MSKTSEQAAHLDRGMVWHWWIVRLITGLESFIAYVLGRVFFSIRRTERKPVALRTMERILVVRLDGVGDLVMTSGFLKALRDLYPNARIELVVKKELAHLVELCPYVDEIRSFNAHSLRLMQPISVPLRAVLFARRFIAPDNFDLAINPRWDTDGHYAGFLAYFSGAPERLAYSEKVNVRKQCFNRGFDRLYTTLLENREPKHEFERNLDLIRFLRGDPKPCSSEVWLSTEDVRFAETVCRSAGKQFLVALAPGGGHPRRIWPPEAFARVGESLNQRRDVGIILLGSKQETKLCSVLEGSLAGGVLNMAGRTTLRQAAAIISRCVVFVGNDSGLMHIAAAVGTPVVELSCHPLSGSVTDAASPARFGPWNVRKVILQPMVPTAPCADRCEARIAHCIKAISADQVLSVIDSLWPPDLNNNSSSIASHVDQ
jgi:ADP-heptose:LPS heptosyltransferase